MCSLLSAISATPAAGVVLITPHGKPVNGRWQRWANEAKIPTVRGIVVFENPTAMGCAQAGGCSVQGFWAVDPELSAASRDSLYFELGHQFDWRYLTNRMRHRFAVLWHHPHASWYSSARASEHGTEDGLGADFAQMYAECAWGYPALATQWVSHPAPPRIAGINARPTCNLIRRAQVMKNPRLSRNNWLPLPKVTLVSETTPLVST